MKNLTKIKEADTRRAEVELNRRMARKSIMQVLGNWQLYLMLLPAVLYLILFVYKPMYGIQIAFREFKFKTGITGSEWVGLNQFETLFNSYWFPLAFKNTLIISITSLVVTFPLPIIFAMLINEVRNEKVKRTVQTISYAPHFISTVVMCGVVIMLLNPTNGIVNIFIEMLGGSRVAFTQDPKLFKWVYIFSGVWQSLGWSSVIYFAALAAVDKGLLEAAEIDGANRIHRIIHINIPTILPTIMIQLILNAGKIMSLGYEKVLLLQNQMNLMGSEILATYVYKVGLQQYSYSFSTAANIFNSVCNCILLITVNRLSKWITKQGIF